MAERRMMAIRVIDDDAFLDLPMGARLLYYDLTMRADDDGFITPKKVMRLIGASQKDLDSLINAGFLIAFDSGVVAITHWRQSNALRKDRYTPTAYQEEFSLLQVNNGIYEKYSGCQTVAKVSSQDKEHGNQMATNGCQTGNQAVTKRQPAVATGKDRIGESLCKEKDVCPKGQDIEKESSSLASPVQSSLSRSHPSLLDISEFVASNGLDVDAKEFYEACERDSWQVRGQPMRSWQKALFAASRNGTFSRDKPRTARKKAAGMARDLPEDLPAGVYNL